MTHHPKRLLVTVVGAFAAGVLAPATAHADIVGFTSPSGNIGCMIDSSSVRCDVRDRTWSPPPKPADCESMMNYGQGIVLTAGQPARFVCAGDTALGGGPALAYGDKITKGSLQCESETSGVTCRDIGDGGGFSISRDGYQLS
ncbi:MULTISPECIES: DUF6636 domain-containing protein [Mycobacterium ulcerans group]|nr:MULTISPECIES: DUF6636 domain-containing protein [Mycobacterium ulcerans group]EUA89190.1 hypothetical protein I551_4343 [Mycobacterium ulcerans str. Harvey]ULL11400.1 hypothetical protein CKW46_20480 [Mycobacterium liflandii]AGC63415.1 hypothetical protein MULP_03785 [Mycobacterium liflandii 128FXT]EPQ77306.1 hypothetical protein MMMB2_1968 [Mycobacterium marinum MB2]MBC9861083.1 hypothetical protein [Mycobacterium pseudoshottsii]